jgi:hypothetical protein
MPLRMGARPKGCATSCAHTPQERMLSLIETARNYVPNIYSIVRVRLFPRHALMSLFCVLSTRTRRF